MSESYTPSEVPTKVCATCKKTLPLTEFSKRSDRPIGVQASCKLCWSMLRKERYHYYKRLTPVAPPGHKYCGGCKAIHPREMFYRNASNSNGLSERCRHCERAYSMKYRRWQKIAVQYGITKEDYMRMHDAQCGVCAICGGTNEGRMLYVDHNHTTGLVRGLLCRSCNQAIGYFQDDPELVARARQYLLETDGTGKGILRKPGVPPQVDAVDSTRKA